MNIYDDDPTPRRSFTAIFFTATAAAAFAARLPDDLDARAITLRGAEVLWAGPSDDETYVDEVWAAIRPLDPQRSASLNGEADPELVAAVDGKLLETCELWRQGDDAHARVAVVLANGTWAVDGQVRHAGARDAAVAYLTAAGFRHLVTTTLLDALTWDGADRH